MIEKYFDPLSKLARDASQCTPNLYTSMATENMMKIIVKLSTKEEQKIVEEAIVK